MIVLTALYLALASLYIFAFAIDKKRESDASGDADTAEQVLLTFLFEFLVNVIITAPVVIYTERILLPAAAVALLRRELLDDEGADEDEAGDAAPTAAELRELGWEPVMDDTGEPCFFDPSTGRVIQPAPELKSTGR